MQILKCLDCLIYKTDNACKISAEFGLWWYEGDHFSVYIIVGEDVQEESSPEDPSEEEKSPLDFLDKIIELFKNLIDKITEFFRSIGDFT